MVIDWTEEVKRKIRRADSIRSPLDKGVYELAMRLVNGLEIDDGSHPLPSVERFLGGLKLRWHNEHATVSLMVVHPACVTFVVEAPNNGPLQWTTSGAGTLNAVRNAMSHLKLQVRTSDEVLKSIGYL